MILTTVLFEKLRGEILFKIILNTRENVVNSLLYDLFRRTFVA